MLYLLDTDETLEGDEQMKVKNLREEHDKAQESAKPADKKKASENVKGTIKKMYRRFMERAKLPVFRVHLLKAITILLCLTMLTSTYFLHVVYADEFAAFNALTTTANLRRDVPRGVIFDRNLEPLVTNASVNVITYQHIPNTYVGTMRQTAEDLTELIDMDYSELTPRDLQDLFIMLNEEYVRDLVPAEARAGRTQAELHALMVDEVTDEHIDTLTSQERAMYAIFVRMNQGAGMTTNIIKEDATDDEIARISERLPDLPGIDVGVDWIREYPSDMGNNPMFGTVTNHQQGIPLERQNYFLNQGYAPNARVGTSNIEQSYQSYLSGFPSQYFLDEDNPILLSEGMPGFQVSLTIDSELQVMVEDIVGDALLRARRAGGPQRFVREAYVVLADPRTGEVLAMVGMVIEERSDGTLRVRQNPMGTFQAASTPGSSIKGASLMVGYDTGATTINQTRHDRPITFRGSPVLRSWEPLGNVNDIRAISESSNIYFVRQTMEMMGIYGFSDGMSLYGANYPSVWPIYRDYFAQLGLGSSTGIDLQHESTGMRVPDRTFFNLLQLSFGQADTYTAMQLAQFASVMANRGDRYQMQVIRDIYMPGSDTEHMQLVQSFEPNLLNSVELTDEQWGRLIQGHIDTVQHPRGTAHRFFTGASYNPAGKTGTAEDVLRDASGNVVRDRNDNTTSVLNRTFVGFAPADNPQVAISVMVPQSQVARTTITGNIANEIARGSLDAFFDLQSSRERSNR